MKITFTYDPDDVESKFHITRINKALDMYLALWTLSQAYRSSDKYGSPLPTRGDFHDILSKYSINLDDLGQ